MIHIIQTQIIKTLVVYLPHLTSQSLAVKSLEWAEYKRPLDPSIFKLGTISWSLKASGDGKAIMQIWAH